MMELIKHVMAPQSIILSIYYTLFCEKSQTICYILKKKNPKWIAMRKVRR